MTTPNPAALLSAGTVTATGWANDPVITTADWEALLADMAKELGVQS